MTSQAYLRGISQVGPLLCSMNAVLQDKPKANLIGMYMVYMHVYGVKLQSMKLIRYIVYYYVVSTTLSCLTDTMHSEFLHNNELSSVTVHTQVAVGGPSAEVVGVVLVELRAGLQARGGHGIWAGHGYVTGEEPRLKKNTTTQPHVLAAQEETHNRPICSECSKLTRYSTNSLGAATSMALHSMGNMLYTCPPTKLVPQLLLGTTCDGCRECFKSLPVPQRSCMVPFHSFLFKKKREKKLA